MNSKILYVALPVASLMILMVPVLSAVEPNPTPSTSEQRAIKILKDMTQYLARAERFSVTSHEAYDAVE